MEISEGAGGLGVIAKANRAPRRPGRPHHHEPLDPEPVSPRPLASTSDSHHQLTDSALDTSRSSRTHHPGPA